jgi:flagellar protein FliL
MSTAVAKKEPAADADTAEGEAAPSPKPAGSKRKLVLMAAPILLAGLVAGLWFSGVLPRVLGLRHDAPKAEASAPAAPVFVELPEMITNLNSNPHRQSFVKIIARLEVGSPEDVTSVQAALPRLQDLFQTYLREMRPEELRGAAGTYRLREELIARASVAAAPAKVKDVLFTELLIQ